MPTITLSVTITVPEGVDVAVEVDRPEVGQPHPVVPPEVADEIANRSPARFRPFIEQYLERATRELGCTVELGGGKRADYLSVFAPPDRCRRARVSSITYSSSRTAIFAGTTNLSSYELAIETLNSGVYSHPKLPHLDSQQAVDEAIELTKIAIKIFER